MYSTLLTATLFSAFAIRGAFAQDAFTLYTVELNQCEPAHITWSEATPPYNLAVVPVDDPCNTILTDLGDHEGHSMTWPNVTVPAGTQVYLSLLDSTDQEAWSAAITVGEGSSEACLANASASPSDVATVSEGATTLTLTSSYSTSASSESETATVVGAANAGTLGNAPSGAMSNVRLPTAATLLASVAGIAAVLAL